MGKSKPFWSYGIEPELGAWRFEFSILPNMLRRNGWYFTLALFKLVSWPKEGDLIARHNYKGFWLSFEILPWLPTFKVVKQQGVKSNK